MDFSAEQMVQGAVEGDRDALVSLFGSHEPRLKRMVAARMDPRLNQRVSSSDVMQEVFIEAQRRVPEYDVDRVSFFVWLRSITGQKLIDLHRFHLKADKRSAAREVRPAAPAPDASLVSLSSYFASQLTTASEAVSRDETKAAIRAALAQLDDLDRELISLRHFEQLTNREAAEQLGLNPHTASSRHLRAIDKLRTILKSGTSGIGEASSLL